MQSREAPAAAQTAERNRANTGGGGENPRGRNDQGAGEGGFAETPNYSRSICTEREPCDWCATTQRSGT